MPVPRPRPSVTRARQVLLHTVDHVSSDHQSFTRCSLITRAACEFLPGPPAAHAPGPLRGDVRARPGLPVPGLDENPPALARAGQREAAGQLTAMRREGQMTWLVAHDIGG